MEIEEPREWKTLVACWHKFVTAAAFRDLEITIPKAEAQLWEKVMDF